MSDKILNNFTDEHTALEIKRLDQSAFNIPQKKTSDGMPFKMGNIKSVILYEMAIDEGQSVMEIIQTLFANNRSYHYLITTNGDIYELLEPLGCARHSRQQRYSRTANKIFGSELAPTYTHSKKTPHMSSPDVASVGILYLKHKNADYNIAYETYESLQYVIAYVINKYTRGIDALSGVLLEDNLIYDRLPEPLKSLCKSFTHDNSFIIKFKEETERLRHNWLAKFIDVKNVVDPNDSNKNAEKTEHVNEDGSIDVEYPKVKFVETKVARGYPSIKFETISI